MGNVERLMSPSGEQRALTDVDSSVADEPIALIPDVLAVQRAAACDLSSSLETVGRSAVPRFPCLELVQNWLMFVV